MFADVISFISFIAAFLPEYKLSQVFLFPGSPVCTRRCDLGSAFQQESPT